MIYSVDLTLPPGTPASALVSQSFSVSPGMLRQEFVTFPDGCAGLAYVRLIVREQVLYPTNPDSWLHTNGITIPFLDELEIEGAGEVFRLEGYNLDTVYPHTITVMLVVVPAQSSTLADLLNSRPVMAGVTG